MVFVTRCPYCGCVWRLPDRETAERGPVKCSSCQHSFDATSDLLQVPESLFPNLPRPARAVRRPSPFAPSQAAAAAFEPLPRQTVPERIRTAAAPAAAPAVAPVSAPAAPIAAPETAPQTAPQAAAFFDPETPAEPAEPPAAPAAEPAPVMHPEAAGAASDAELETEFKGESKGESRGGYAPSPTGEMPEAKAGPEASEAPAAAPVEKPAAVKAPPEALQETQNRPESETPHPQGVPLNPHTGGLTGLKVPAAGEVAPLSTAGKSSKTEPHLGLLPTEGLSKSEPHLDIASLKTGESAQPRPDAAHRSVGSIIPSQAGRSPRDVRVFMAPAPETPDHVPGSSRAAGIASVVTAFILLLVLAAVLAIVFNQRILAAFPQTEPLFIQVCGKVPCPGFFLADASAFEVTRENLRAVDESGNYLLEITVVNRSNFAQAVPSLEIILVDEADNELMRRRLDPRDYLSDPIGTESLAPGRSMSVRFSLQTNVTPTRCVVTPVFPEKDAAM